MGRVWLEIRNPESVENKRIVSTVDALMALCDALESRLKERAVMKQVAGRQEYKKRRRPQDLQPGWRRCWSRTPHRESSG